ncbi:MAG: hypothetical protein IT327_12140 [Anaerolineae bacterium]|nr:hypothetical protein [Anaerolineae bacterium]
MTISIPREVEQLKDDLVWARHFYNQYQKLFGVGPKRIELLNEIAPSFFRDIQRLLWDQLIIGIGRLTDPHEQGKNRNLSLHILTKLAQENKWEFEAEINAKVEETCEAAKTIRTWRMKKVAHRDLPTAMSKGATLDSVNLAQVDRVLSSAGNAINLVYLSLTDTSWSWNLISSHDADELIHYMKLAAIYKDLESDSEEPLRFSEEWMTSRFKDA